MSTLSTSAIRGYLRATIISAALVILGATTAHASTITCGFGGSSNSGPGCESGGTSAFFFFGPYQAFLSFATVSGPFDVSVTDALTSQSALQQAGRLNNFPGYTCVPLDGTNCVDFEFNAPAPGPTTWTGLYTLTFFWNFNTNPNFPNGPGNLIRILHNRGDVPGNGFDTDITVIGSYVGESHPGDDDPGITGTDNNFQSFLVVQAPATPVPEPASLALVGLGLSIFARRRRA